MGDMNYVFWIGPVITVLITFGVLAVVLLRVVLPIFRMKSQARSLLATGIPAEATVLNAVQTGTTLTIGGQQQFGVGLTLEVRVPGRAPYATQTEAFISILQLAQIQTGAAVPIRVDPQDQTKVALDLDAPRAFSQFAPPASPYAPYAAAQQQAMRMLEQLDASNRELSAKGESAQVKILRAQASGVSVNGGNPLMNLEVEVYPASRQCFQATAQAAVAAQSVGKFQPGMMVWVKYDPNDTTRVAVEHSA